MAEDEEGGFEFSTYIIGAIAVTVVLLLLLPMLFVIGKSTAYSAYENLELYQVSDMRESLSSEGDGEGYFIANSNNLLALYVSPMFTQHEPVGFIMR